MCTYLGKYLNIQTQSVTFRLYPLEVVYSARGRRETDAYLEYLAWVGSVWQGITLIFYLLQCYVCRGVKLEFKDIDIVGTFQYAVYATLTRFLLNQSVVFAQHTQNEIEGKMEITLTFPLVILALKSVGDIGKEGSEVTHPLLHTHEGRAREKV